MQAIITQLVFDHALRIRVKSETESAPASRATTVAPTPDNASTAEGSEAVSREGTDETLIPGDDEADTRSVAGSTTSGSTAKGKSPAGKSTDSASSKKEEKKSDDAKNTNLVGKINNLVTSDLSSLQNGFGLFLMGGSSLVFDMRGLTYFGFERPGQCSMCLLR